jgi:hypothetical protein
MVFWFLQRRRKEREVRSLDLLIRNLPNLAVTKSSLPIEV